MKKKKNQHKPLKITWCLTFGEAKNLLRKSGKMSATPLFSVRLLNNVEILRLGKNGKDGTSSPTRDEF